MVDERSSRSSPTASIRLSSSSKLAEIVISLTGVVRWPCSIKKPAAPREKSPVTPAATSPATTRLTTSTKAFRCVFTNSNFFF